MDYTIHSSGFPLLQKFHLLFFQISFITFINTALKRRRTYGYPKHPPAERFFRRTACQCPGWAENHPVFFSDHHCRIGKRGQLCSEPADCQNRGLRKHGRPLCPDHRPDAAAPCPGGFSHVPDAGVPRHHAPHCPGAVRFSQRDAAGL